MRTFNARWQRGAQGMRLDLAAVLYDKPDMLAVCEASRFRKAIADECALRPFKVLQKTRPHAKRNVAIIYDASRWSVVDWGVHKMHAPKPKWFGASTRYAVGACLENRATGERVTLISYHAVSTIEKNGRPRKRPRVKLARRGFRRLRRLAKRLHRRFRCPVILAGDANVDYQADKRVKAWGFPHAVFVKHGNFREAWNASRRPVPNTHKRRTIDRLFYKGRRLRLIFADVLRGLATDHASVRVRFHLRRRR